MQPILSRTAAAFARKTPAPQEPSTTTLASEVAELKLLVHATMLHARPGYKESIQSGTACAPNRALARETFIDGFSGLERTKRANSFDTKFPTDADYKASFKQWVAKTNAVDSPAPAPAKPTAAPAPASSMAAFATEPSKPYPSFLLTTARRDIEAVATAAGVPIATRLAEVISGVEKDHSGNVVDMTFSYGGRTHIVFATQVTPFHSENEVGRYVTRLALASYADTDENESVARGWLASIRFAMRERNAGMADKAIITAGSANGF